MQNAQVSYFCKSGADQRFLNWGGGGGGGAICVKGVVRFAEFFYLIFLKYSMRMK